MYDFANSGYTTVVITAVYSAYFVSIVAEKAVWATFAWTAALSLSYALIMITAPLVGAWADAHAAKKKLLALSTLGCVACTALLWFSGPGTLAASIVLIVLSNYFFGSGENLIAAFLPELADSEAMGRVSGWGWSVGYLGGLLSLGICLAYITWAQGRGLPASTFVPATMLITAALFALASLPTFLFLRERSTPQTVRSEGTNGEMRAAWGRALQTLREARRYRDLRRFLVCLVFYQAGIQAVIALAAIYAQEAMQFTTQQTIVLILVVNLTAAIGAFAFGYVQDAIGHVRSVSLTLVGWIAMVLIAGMAQGAEAFWLAANIAGLCMGASQAAGRAIVGVLAPPARLGEFFGLWGLAVKLASIFGPLSYGLMTWIFAGDHRTAIMLLGAYFIIGLGILRGVDIQRGRAAALGG
ncbi:MAG: MFS transporter [Betaproteobacteria bacterium]|nr:MFS transporter [Betaproteobacteria bacterium]